VSNKTLVTVNKLDVKKKKKNPPYDSKMGCDLGLTAYVMLLLSRPIFSTMNEAMG